MTIKITFLHSTTEEIHQTEVLGDVDLIPLNEFVVIIILSGTEVVGEGINLKGNVYLLTEPNQVIQLFESIHHHVGHGTRPIEDEDQTMVLTIRNYGNLFE